MSAEQLVEDIITQALEVGAAKAQAADNYASQAVAAASGQVWLNHNPFQFTPSAVEPNVYIPSVAAGVDGALYDSTYNRILADLTGKFESFFATYFPNECDYLAGAQQWLCDVLTRGGTGIKPAVEDQMWQRDRSRVLQDVRRAGEEVVSTFASRGFPLPPGAMQHQLNLTQQAGLEKVAQASRDVAIKQAEIEIENIRFAVQQALDYRIKGIAAAADYMKAMALGPEIAMRLATSSADAQARLISAASQYYSNRIRIEEIKLDVAKSNAALTLDAGKVSAGALMDAIRNKANTVASVAQSLGQQAAAALNAVHASAAVAVQGETA
jgi:hypothetical protein